MNRQELHTMALKAKEKQISCKHRIGVCCGAGCISIGAEEVLKKIQEDIKARGLEDEVSVVPTGCMGPCNQGPLVKYLPENTLYQKVDKETVSALNEAQLVKRNQSQHHSSLQIPGKFLLQMQVKILFSKSN